MSGYLRPFLVGAVLGMALAMISVSTGEISLASLGAWIGIVALAVVLGLMAMALALAVRCAGRLIDKLFPGQELPPDVVDSRLRIAAQWIREGGQAVILGVFASWAFIVGGDIGPALRRDPDASGAAILLAALGLAAAIKAIHDAARLATEVVAARWEAEADLYAQKAAILDKGTAGAGPLQGS